MNLCQVKSSLRLAVISVCKNIFHQILQLFQHAPQPFNLIPSFATTFKTNKLDLHKKFESVLIQRFPPLLLLYSDFCIGRLSSDEKQDFTIVNSL